MARQELEVPFSGLHTAPSAYGAAPRGALKVAENVVIRSPGVVAPRPGLGPEIAQADVDVTSVWAMADFQSIPGVVDHIVIGDPQAPSTATIYRGVSPVTTPEGNDLEWTRGRVFSAVARKNMYLTADDDVRKLLPGEFQFEAPRAGVPPPFLAVTDDPSSGSLVPPTTYYSYRAVKVRRDAGGLIVRSAPSNRVIYGNTTAGTRNVRIRVWQHQEDDNDPDVEEWEVYRSLASTTAEVPDEHFLCKTFGPQPTDANLTEDFVDTLADADLGAPLYTNVDEEGIENANLRPPQAYAIAEYNGSLVLGDLTFPAEITVAVDYSISLTAADSSGVGDRTATGTYTNGSNQITGLASTAGFRVGQIIRDTVGEWSGATDFVRVTAVAAATLTMSATYSGATGAKSRVISDSIRIGSQYFPIRNTYEEGLVSVWSDGSIVGEVYNPSTDVYALTNDTIRYTRTGAGVSNTPAGIRTITFRAITPTAAPFTIHATHGSAYTPPLPEPTATGKTAGQDTFESGIMWSKFLEPEHFSALDLQLLGADESQTWRMVRAGDGLWIFKQDGLWRLSGASRDAGFRIDRTSSLRLLHPNAAVESGDRAFAWTDQGLMVLSAGVSEISSTPVRDQLRAAQNASTAVTDYGIWVGANTKNNEILVAVPTNNAGAFTVSEYILVFNLETAAWTSWTIGATCALYDRNGVLMFGLDEDELMADFDGDVFVTRSEAPETSAANLHFDQAAGVVPTAVSGRVVTFTTPGSYVPAVGDCFTQSGDLYWVTAVVNSTNVQLDRTGYATSAGESVRRGFAVRVAPIAMTAKNPSLLKLWCEGSWLFGSLFGVVQITMEFGSSRAESTAGFTRTFTDNVQSESYTNNPRSERFIVHRNYARAEQLFPELSIDNAPCATWRLEGLSLFYQPMSSRLSGR